MKNLDRLIPCALCAVVLLGFVFLLVGCKQTDSAASREAQLAEKVEWAVGRHRVQPIGVDEALQPEQDSEGKGPLFVDTRARPEFDVSRIPGAVFWPRDGSPPPQEIEAAIKSSRPVVLYCSIGERSGAAGDELLNKFEGSQTPQIYNLAGGLFLWAEKGGPLEGSNLVHPYDANWGKLLKPDLRAPLEE